MQINIFGKPGDGKSYSTVFFVGLFALAERRRWVTNINGVKPDEINSYLNALSRRETSSSKDDKLDTTERKLLKIMRDKGTAAGDFDFKPLIVCVEEDAVKSPDFWYSPDFPTSSLTQPGDVVTIDEARRYFGSGVKVPERTIMCILKHRHYVDARGYSMDLYFIAQQPAHLQREVAGNAQFTYQAKRMLTAGKLKEGRFRLQYYEGAVGATELRRGEYYDAVEERLNPRIFALYKSFEGATGFESGAKAPTVWDVKFWGLPLFKVVLPAFALLSAFAFYKLFVFFTDNPLAKKPQDKPASISTSASSVPANPGSLLSSSVTLPASAVQPSGALPEDPVYRLTGFYDYGAYRYAILTDKDNRVRYVKDFKYAREGLSPEIIWQGKTIGYWSGPVDSLPQLQEKNTPASKKGFF